MKVAIVGATGVVGSVLLDLLEKRKFPLTEIIPVASEKSVGNKISFKGQEYSIVSLADAVKMKPNVALFSAGGSTSLEWAPKFAEVGTRVVDNSSAWRMDSKKKLVVSEVNANVLTKDDYIIANPNCSTMQMLVVLAPLHKKYKIKRLVISTYQSVSGTGKNAIDQLNNEREGRDGSKVYPYSIDQNLLPHCDVFEEDGYTKEENKLINETRKILNDNSIQITSTAVRVPIEICHGESVNIEFENEFEIDSIFEILKKAPWFNC
jgi:aspartate-semialdehyde dehydrogenase